MCGDLKPYADGLIGFQKQGSMVLVYIYQPYPGSNHLPSILDAPNWLHTHTYLKIWNPTIPLVYHDFLHDLMTCVVSIPNLTQIWWVFITLVVPHSTKNCAQEWPTLEYRSSRPSWRTLASNSRDHQRQHVVQRRRRLVGARWLNRCDFSKCWPSGNQT